MDALDINSLVVSLAQKRKQVAGQIDRVTQLKEILEKSQEWVMLQAAIDKLSLDKEVANEAYQLLCDTSLDLGDKHPHPAVTIKDVTLVDYDEDEFKSWAIEHNHPGLLNLNKSAAKKVATGPTAPDFVTVTKEPKAYIKNDLSEYIKE